MDRNDLILRARAFIAERKFQGRNKDTPLLVRELVAVIEAEGQKPETTDHSLHNHLLRFVIEVLKKPGEITPQRLAEEADKFTREPSRGNVRELKAAP